MTAAVAPDPDPVMTGVGRAIGLAYSGEPEAARRGLLELWTQVGESGDALHRCAIAHQLADLCPEVGDELTWDLRALAAADAITTERADAAGLVGGAAGLYPSLHLNVGEAYRRLGDLPSARRHLRAGLLAADALGDEGYGAMIRRGLAGLADRVRRPGR